jgi:hypothetical protein
VEIAEMINKVVEMGARKLPLLDARNVPSQIIGIIAKCLFFEKKDRYLDAQELFHQIQPVFQELEDKSAGMEEKKAAEEAETSQEENVLSMASTDAQHSHNSRSSEGHPASTRNHEPAPQMKGYVFHRKLGSGG